ncbi:hypothetical protein WMY93_006578 [Mugilogobius chulae]|uniref:Small monomeric GTPase n=1 Tax=Mugilogobius chulae TaxID=88201 RepID=A0AAW0PZZ7_9GOBI
MMSVDLPRPQSSTLLESQLSTGQIKDSSKVMLAYNSASQHLGSAGIKAGLGMLKLASSHWKQEVCLESAAQLQKSNSCQCKRSLDHLVSLVLQSHAQRQDTTKPQNCKRIVVLGAPRVGKTSILRRFLHDGFVEEYKPTSEDFLRKLFRINKETYQIDILDASKERYFPAKRRLSILTGDIFLLVFSVDDRSSFEEVCALRTEILAAKSKISKSCSPDQCAQVPLVVCANKVDLQESARKVSPKEICQEFGNVCAYFETSAKDSTNLGNVFETLATRGGLPTETGPFQHRKVSLRSYHALGTGRARCKGHQKTERDDPCGALYPFVRRPSFRTDLRHVIGPHATGKPNKALEKCHIQ